MKSIKSKWKISLAHGKMELSILEKYIKKAKTINKGLELSFEKHYAFDMGDVLFKPTFTNEVVFRNNIDDSLSYFVAGDISEDSGFAIKPWVDIKLTEVNFILEDNLCVVMGVLNLKPLDSENKTKIAFTFILVKDNHELKIKVHHSSEIKQ